MGTGESNNQGSRKISIELEEPVNPMENIIYVWGKRGYSNKFSTDVEVVNFRLISNEIFKLGGKFRVYETKKGYISGVSSLGKFDQKCLERCNRFLDDLARENNAEILDRNSDIELIKEELGYQYNHSLNNS